MASMPEVLVTENASASLTGGNGGTTSSGRLLRRGRTKMRSRSRAALRRKATNNDEQLNSSSAAANPQDASSRLMQRRSLPRVLLQRKSSILGTGTDVSGGDGGRPSHHRSAARGGFINPWPSAGRTASMRTIGMGSRSFLRRAPTARSAPDEVVAALALLAGRPDWDAASAALQRDGRACAATWLGHCTWLLRFRRLTVLTDPVWAGRLGSNGNGARRAVAPVCLPEELPTPDICIITSAHADHLDTHAVRALASRVRCWVVPLGVDAILRDCGVPNDRITSLDWWGEANVGSTRIVCVPAQHAPASEAPRALWCSWLIAAPGHTLYFCGATGYRAASRGSGAAVADLGPNAFERRKYAGPVCPVFKQVATKYGRVDTAILPLGHYKPRPAMAAVQGDPIDMLHIHRDLRARKSLAQRWGTYLAPHNESLLDPVRALETAIVDSPVSEHEFVYVHHGRMVVT